MWSGIDPVGTVLSEYLEDDAAKVSAEGADGLVVCLAFGAFSLIVALRLRDQFAMVIDSDQHCRLGADGTVTLSPPDLTPGEKVRIITGPFVDCVAVVRKLASKDRAELLLNVLGGGVTTTVPRRAIASAA